MFKSVDAACFEDYDDDGDTDIIIVKSWENYTTAVVYEGQELQAKDKFWLNQALSEELTYNLDEINISNIFDYLNYDEENIPDGIMPYDAVKRYSYGSGSGAWGVLMQLYSDGTFDAEFTDSNINCCYENRCTDKFGNIIQLSDTIYEMTLEEYNPEIEVRTTWTDDEYVHEATDVRGIFPGTTFHLYLPGTPVDEMPENVANAMMTTFTDDGCLIGVTIYNDETSSVFRTY